MNNKSFRDIWFKLFKSGNPAMLYIGINGIVFLLGVVVGLFVFFGGEQQAVEGFVRTYFAFPSDISLWPTRFYTLITYAFFHRDLFHILFNLLWLYWMGSLFLTFLKPLQFHVVFWGGIIFGAIAFALMYNFIPQFGGKSATLIGASAAVMAIFSATTTLAPNYSIHLFIFGDVKLKYLLLVYIAIDMISMSTGSANLGGSVSHLGGALFGFTYIRLLQNGTDLSSFFKKKSKLKVVRNEAPTKRAAVVNQEEIDAILDKISKSGYENLSAKEKQTLFDASKN